MKAEWNKDPSFADAANTVKRVRGPTNKKILIWTSMSNAPTSRSTAAFFAP